MIIAISSWITLQGLSQVAEMHLGLDQDCGSVKNNLGKLRMAPTWIMFGANINELLSHAGAENL